VALYALHQVHEAEEAMAGLTGYVTPAMLIAAPTGISWSTIPVPSASATQQLTSQQDICMRATASAEAFLNQQVRCTIDVQTDSAPSRRVYMDNDGVHFTCNHFPVLAVVAAQTAPAGTFPRVYTDVTSGNWEVDDPPSINTGSAVTGGDGQGGNTILLAGGTIDGWRGRKGYRIAVTYLNGWPHAGITASMLVNALAVNVDDVTGWSVATAAAPITCPIYDGANSEVVQVIGVASVVNGTTGLAAYGPGVLTLAAGTGNVHAGPVSGVATCVISTLPATIMSAVIKMAVAEAMVRGATATSVQRNAGQTTKSGSAGDLYLEGCELLLPYRRVV
jgi:hypothetical protein